MRVEEYILGPGGIGKPEHLKKFLGFSLKLLKISFYHTHTHTYTHALLYFCTKLKWSIYQIFG